MTSYAKRCSKYYSDTQVQSLYHEVKRNADVDSGSQTDRDMYLTGVEKFASTVRNDESLTDSQRESLLRRIDAARTSDPIDSKSWAALQQLPSTVDASELQYEGILNQSAHAHGVSPEEIHAWVQEARGGSWQGGGSFVDYADYPDNFRYDQAPGVPPDGATLKALRKLGYETFLAQPYPVFVYGTLRQGQGNNRVIGHGADRYVSGEVRGVGIYGPHRGFPYAAEHPDPTALTKGEIVYLKQDSSGVSARHGMDGLEGFRSDDPLNSHYERRLHLAQIDGDTTPTPVWIYFARGSAQRQLQEHDRIIDGDWVKAKNEYRDPSYIRSRLLGF